MTDDLIREQFLEAEREASAIAEALKAVRSEIEAHGTARDSIAEALGATQALTEELVPLAERMSALIATLSELGVDQFRADLDAVGRAAETSLSKQEELLVTQAQALSQEEFRKEMEAGRTRADSVHQQLVSFIEHLQGSLGAHEKRVMDAMAARKAHEKGVTEALARLQNRQMWIVVLVALFGLAVVALRFLP